MGAPIVVEGRLWGAIIVSTTSVAPSTESRVADFTELVAMAISNVEARAALAESRERIVVAGDEERRRSCATARRRQQRLVHRRQARTGRARRGHRSGRRRHAARAVRDDGVVGARADGSGLVGLADRVAALKGWVRIETHDGEGTHVAAEIPVSG